MNLSLNYTSFVNPKVAIDIRTGMAHCLKTGQSVRLTNRKGEHWLLIQVVRDTMGYRFGFFDTEGREHGDDILKACIRQWSDLDSLQFWSLNAECYDLKEHPLVTVAREESVKRSEAARVADLKARGATHKVISYGGAVVGYGAYQRDWLGRKKVYIVADCDSHHYAKPVKMTHEAHLMIARMEAL